jgi:hypothetical protein
MYACSLIVLSDNLCCVGGSGLLELVMAAFIECRTSMLIFVPILYILFVRIYNLIYLAFVDILIVQPWKLILGVIVYHFIFVWTCCCHFASALYKRARRLLTLFNYLRYLCRYFKYMIMHVYIQDLFCQIGTLVIWMLAFPVQLSSMLTKINKEWWHLMNAFPDETQQNRTVGKKSMFH